MIICFCILQLNGVHGWYRLIYLCRRWEVNADLPLLWISQTLKTTLYWKSCLRLRLKVPPKIKQGQYQTSHPQIRVRILYLAPPLVVSEKLVKGVAKILLWPAKNDMRQHEIRTYYSTYHTYNIHIRDMYLVFWRIMIFSLIAFTYYTKIDQKMK